MCDHFIYTLHRGYLELYPLCKWSTIGHDDRRVLPCLLVLEDGSIDANQAVNVDTDDVERIFTEIDVEELLVIHLYPVRLH